VYLHFFTLRESPFNLTPDPRFLFLSAQHEEALTHLLYGIYERKGFIEITGEVGTGKTVLCRVLLERLDKTVSTALIFNSYLTKMELLQAITDDFGLQPRETTSKGYIDVLNEYLLSEFAAGRNAVVVMDEAQNLEPTVLEQLRMLSNLETERGKLLQIILVGQPELHAKLATLQMRQLEQRIAVRFHIHELTRAETEQYITHRMSVAGAAHTVIWSRRALRLIHHHTGGIPRRLNLLCDRVLMTTFVRETHRVSAAIVRRSVQELASPWQSRRMCWRRRVALGGGAGLGLLGLIAGGVFLWPTVHTQWYPRVVEQVLAVSRNTAPPQLTALPPQPASLPSPISAPASPVAPVLATPELVPPAPPLEIDAGLARTHWPANIQAEEPGGGRNPGNEGTNAERVVPPTPQESARAPAPPALLSSGQPPTMAPVPASEQSAPGSPSVTSKPAEQSAQRQVPASQPQEPLAPVTFDNTLTNSNIAYAPLTPPSATNDPPASVNAVGAPAPTAGTTSDAQAASTGSAPARGVATDGVAHRTNAASASQATPSAARTTRTAAVSEFQKHTKATPTAKGAPAETAASPEDTKIAAQKPAAPGRQARKEAGAQRPAGATATAKAPEGFSVQVKSAGSYTKRTAADESAEPLTAWEQVPAIVAGQD
jgi:type II secretory pathway predicted ATPase ExeA